MSEIKGQLLGVILTLAIFAVVFTAMKTSFTKMSNGVTSQVNSTLTEAGISAAGM